MRELQGEAVLAVGSGNLHGEDVHRKRIVLN
jgi:hypothetical protein